MIPGNAQCPDPMMTRSDFSPHARSKHAAAWALSAGIACSAAVVALQSWSHDQAAVVLVALAHATALPWLLGARASARHLGLYALAISVPLCLEAGLERSVPALLTAFGSSLLGVCLYGVARKADDVLAAMTSLGRLRDDLKEGLRRAEDELLRLRVEARTRSEQRRELETMVESMAGELGVLKRKADSLSLVLQRVMPYEQETGLLTAAKFESVLRREWARMQRQEQPVGLVLLSLDHFDRYYETTGRVAAEAALRRIAELLRRAGQRPGDVAARLAPDKFALLFPEADHRHGDRVATKLCTRIRQLGLANADSPSGLLTMSCGVASMIPHGHSAAADLQQRADAALYEARFQGGDRCVRFRTMPSLRLDRWNIDQEGLLTADGLVRKLALLGYRGQPRTLQPGETVRERRLPADTVEAVVDGQVKISLDGESRVLRAGDCLFVPKGQVASLEVVSPTPAVCMEATPG